MARKLINDLTWSVSRDRLFHDCERAYYYNYYGAWEGWDKAAPEPRRTLYILKNMQSLEMWAGSIVHEVIAEALRRYALKQRPVTAGELQAHARQKMRRGWLEAVHREWQADPKNKLNLCELYHGNGKSLPRDMTEACKQRVNDCLQAFADSAVLREILAATYLSWKPIDQLNSFSMDGGLKVWCALDFAYTDPAGNLRILDWKTGSEKEDALQLQLACYVSFAEQQWHVAVENIQPAGIFLREDARVSQYDVTPEILTEARNRILTSAAEMRAKLADASSNTAREDDFATCGKTWTCQRCNFRSVCPSPAV
jgi:hypothetical protein